MKLQLRELGDIIKKRFNGNLIYNAIHQTGNDRPRAAYQLWPQQSNQRGSILQRQTKPNCLKSMLHYTPEGF